MSLTLAIIALGFLIVVHEAGHYIVAKLCKMRVERFSIGFGPALWKFRPKYTEFQIAALPFGGFVQISGMNPHEDIDLNDPNVYPNRPTVQRILTIFAGPATNYFFAIVLIFCVLMSVGRETGRMQVADVHDGEPAVGKLFPGDRIVSVNGKPIRWRADSGIQHAELTAAIQEGKGAPVTILVTRGGKEVEVTIAPRVGEIPSAKGPEKGYLIGIVPSPEREQIGVGTALVQSAKFPFIETRRFLRDIYGMIKRTVPAEVVGPVGITRAIRGYIRLGWVRTFEILALLNVYLGMFNLFPLPALDGGRLAFLGYELATRRRPNPKVETAVHMVGMAIFAVLFLLVTFKDIKNIFI
ncbi:MAG: site-2 protease family protein [Deltaproteobacteria bacterium]|nr:site-2 protease family protein [Deltaproteobacteria bacterium]